MSAREKIEVFVAQVISGDHVGAIADWYADDATMQENQGQPRVGRQALMEGERRTLAGVAKVETELLSPVVVDGDRVAIHWRFTFTQFDGKVRKLEEVAWQTWKDGKVWRETFFYDPAQMQQAIAE